MWIAQTGGAPGDNTLIRMALDGSTLLLDTPTKNSSPAGLATGPNGGMWFAESNVGQIAEIAMPAGPITEFPLSSSSEQPIAVTTGADGNIWFIDANVGIVGKVTVTGAVTEYHLSQIQFGRGITTGPDGNVWFVGYRSVNGYVGKVTPSGVVTEYQIPGPQGHPSGIALGADGNLWVSFVATSNSGGDIIRVTPSGQMLEHWLGPYAQPGSIARGGPYSMVYTVNDLPQFGTIGLGGIAVAGGLPGGKMSRASAVALGPDGNEWFSGSVGSASAVFVHVRLLMNVSPSPVSFGAPGQTQPITVTEDKYSSSWTAQSSDSGVATVAPGSSNDTFVVTATGQGTCTVTVSDAKGNSFLVPVSVQ